MEHIVVGVDESSCAAVALHWAVRERQWHGAALSAVLAWTYLGQHHGTGDDVFQPEYGEQDAAAALEQILTKAVPDEVESIRRVVVNDLPSQALLDQGAHADLLVVGARGLGGFRGMLLGSVSQQVVLHATVPVAIVREAEEHGRGAPDDVPEHVVVGIDGSATSQRALAWAAAEARARGATLTVVHAWHPAVLPNVGLMPAYVDVGFEDEAGQLVAEQLAAVSLEGLGDKVATVVVNDSPVRAVLEAASDATLVVAGSRGRGGFAGLLLGSVSQHLVHHAHCPVVVVPPEDKRRHGE